MGVVALQKSDKVQLGNSLPKDAFLHVSELKGFHSFWLGLDLIMMFVIGSSSKGLFQNISISSPLYVVV